MHVIDLTVFQPNPYSYVPKIEGTFFSVTPAIILLHPHKDEDLK